MNKPLWQPSEKLKENSLLRDFCKFINFQSQGLPTFILFLKWALNCIYHSSFSHYRMKAEGDYSPKITQFAKIENSSF